MARVVMALGDPAGVGPRVTAVALGARPLGASARWLIVGPGDIWRRAVAEHAPTAARSALLDLPLLDTGAYAGPRGRPTAEGGAAAWAGLEAAIGALRVAEGDVLCTAPVHKGALAAAGFPHAGVTEWLAERTGVREPLMTFVASPLRVALATRHIPLAQVGEALRAKGVRGLVEDLARLAAFLRQGEGLDRPRMALAGLNPHAGEGGRLGLEELEVIAPAVREALARGLDVRGPAVPDHIFAAHARGEVDAVLALYHDQGLIPMKALAFERTVHLTLGLPFLRVSPDHGTAMDRLDAPDLDARPMGAALARALAWAGSLI